MGPKAPFLFDWRRGRSLRTFFAALSCFARKPRLGILPRPLSGKKVRWTFFYSASPLCSRDISASMHVRIPNPSGSNTFRTLPLPKPGVTTPGLGNGGEGGIRTLGAFLTHTHFPGVLLKPLGHLSVTLFRDNTWRHAPKRDARVNYRPVLRNKAIRQRGKVRPNRRAGPRPRIPAGSAETPPRNCGCRSGRRRYSGSSGRGWRL